MSYRCVAIQWNWFVFDIVIFIFRHFIKSNFPLSLEMSAERFIQIGGRERSNLQVGLQSKYNNADHSMPWWDWQYMRNLLVTHILPWNALMHEFARTYLLRQTAANVAIFSADNYVIWEQKCFMRWYRHHITCISYYVAAIHNMWL